MRQSIHVAVIKDNLMCPRHPKVDLDMFCETCSESVCLKCSFLSHKGHDIVGVTEKVNISQYQSHSFRFCKFLNHPPMFIFLSQNEGVLPDLKKSLDSAGQLRQRLKLSLKVRLIKAFGFLYEESKSFIQPCNNFHMSEGLIFHNKSMVPDNFCIM